MDSTLEKADVLHAEAMSSKSNGVSDHADVDMNNSEISKENGTHNLKLDKRGFPLVPQPTNHKDDPLNWSPMLKLCVALQISWLACLGPMSSAVINPAFVPLGKAFKISTVEASYELTVYIIFAGVGPLFIAPFANVYGRRPIYLFGNLLAGIMNLVAAHSTTWNGILITRVFCGIGSGATVAIGAATICDMYFQHERGVYIGIYTFFLTNGPHVAPLIGGFVAKFLNWRFCFSIPAYIQLGTFVLTIFFLPETLYSRRAETVNDPNYKAHSFVDLLLFKRGKLSDRSVKVSDFAKPFFMVKYLSITIPGLYYMTCFGYGTVLFAVTGAALFKEFYKFDTAQTGLMLSIPLLIGCLIGEFNAGWVTDYMSNRYARKHDGQRLPEARLDAIWLALLIPVGVIIEGVCLTHFKTASWVGTAFGMGIACLGLQVATTVVYAYTTDCYKPQSAEISSVLNTFRQIFAAVISFYAIRFGDLIKFEYAWLVFAMINVAFLLPMFALRIYGAKWRALEWQKPPNFHMDI